MVLGFGDPTKGMTRIWGHFVILVGCERVILRPQIMLKCTYIVLSKTTKVILKTPEEPFEQVTSSEIGNQYIAEFLLKSFFFAKYMF